MDSLKPHFRISEFQPLSFPFPIPFVRARTMAPAPILWDSGAQSSMVLSQMLSKEVGRRVNMPALLLGMHPAALFAERFLSPHVANVDSVHKIELCLSKLFILNYRSDESKLGINELYSAILSRCHVRNHLDPLSSTFRTIPSLGNRDDAHSAITATQTKTK